MESKTGKKKVYRLLLVASTCLLCLALGLALYDIATGNLSTESSSASGYYYYTDVPGWQEIFIQSPFLGFDKPLLAMIFFFGWGFLMYRILVYIERKPK